MPKTTTDDVVERDGTQWRRRPGVTTTAEETFAARQVIREIWRQSNWNPWVREDRQAEFDRAVEICDDWEPVEGWARPKKSESHEAMLQRIRERSEREAGRIKKRQERDKGRYRRDREEARLALLEAGVYMEYLEAELAGHRDHTHVPHMPEASREKAVAELEQRISDLRERVEGWTRVAGNLENVVDEKGWLPRDRREFYFALFCIHREAAVRRLRKEIAELEAELKATKDKDERKKLRARLDDARRGHDHLVALPEMTADDICSECTTPRAEHTWTICGDALRFPEMPYYYPGDQCIFWPSRVAASERLWETVKELEAARKRREAEERKANMPPPPQPLAVIEGRTLDDILPELNKIRRKHPDAEIRRGRSRDSWEVWLAANPSTKKKATRQR